MTAGQPGRITALTEAKPIKTYQHTNTKITMNTTTQAGNR